MYGFGGAAWSGAISVDGACAAEGGGGGGAADAIGAGVVIFGCAVMSGGGFADDAGTEAEIVARADANADAGADAGG